MAKFVGAIFNCRTCGKEFKIPQCRKKLAKYCSKECADVHRHDTTRVEKIEKECQRCGKKLYVHPCHSKRGKYCSLECTNKEFAKHGKNETNFYGRAFWKKLRELIMERDGLRCRKCGEKQLLHVHHVKERRNGGKDNTGNLLTLCHPCHRKEHKSYAYLRENVR
jgi:5-methylcytosine-specific restriction endonuclease McrA